MWNLMMVIDSLTINVYFSYQFYLVFDIFFSIKNDIASM
jgi:hypothetical protein